MEQTVKFIFESGMLKRVKRSGWWAAGIKDPESVAEHCFRTAIVAFIIAKLEGSDSHKLCSAAVFHDMHECRILDLHKIASRYILNQEEAGKKAEEEQIANLPLELRESIQSLYELNEKETRILRDADLLECAFQAKEYLELGHATAQEWIDSIEKRLKTKTAKSLLEKMKKTRSTDWFNGLKRLD